MKKTLFYFGCIDSVGHFLFTGGYPRESNAAAKQMPGLNPAVLQALDGTFVPWSTREQGEYLVSVVPPVIIVAWHDYTVDKRPGSHSTLVGYGYESVAEIFEAAKKLYPQVMNRQPMPKPVKTLATGQ